MRPFSNLRLAYLEDMIEDYKNTPRPADHWVARTTIDAQEIQSAVVLLAGENWTLYRKRNFDSKTYTGKITNSASLGILLAYGKLDYYLFHSFAFGDKFTIDYENKLITWVSE